jgi:glycosyltransferase involved in cell wall biosynthesis
MQPSVSLLTPTQNRRVFIPWLIEMVSKQTYPKNRIEWIIADDGDEDLTDLVCSIPMVRYIKIPNKMSIGSKRNFLASEAKGEILIHIDDDDYYPPSRISHAVHRLVISKKLLAGSNQLLIYNIFTSEIRRFGPLGARHSCGATMAYRKDYWLKNKFDDSAYIGEESAFTNYFTNDIIQLDTLSTIICIAHNKNTVTKDNCIPHRPSDLKLAEIIHCEEAEKMYGIIAKSLAFKST